MGALPGIAGRGSPITDPVLLTNATNAKNSISSEIIQWIIHYATARDTVNGFCLASPLHNHGYPRSSELGSEDFGTSTSVEKIYIRMDIYYFQGTQYR